MPRRIVVVGGGAAGTGAATAAKQAASDADVMLFTEYEDIAYSPCGIPYAHGREVKSFESLFLQTKEFYAEEYGLDVRYETRVRELDLRRRCVTLEGGEEVPYDRLILATGFEYAPPGVPGSNLEGQYYVKNIRRAMEWDKVLDGVKSAVVMDATPLGLEMATAVAHRQIETHFVDPHPYLLAEAADPDIMQPVEDSLVELGVTMHLRTEIEAFLGSNGRVRAVKTSEGEIPADLVVVCTPKVPNNRLAREAGIKVGSTGGLIVDDHMATPEDGVFAAGDCVELPHGLTDLPLQGLTGSHAYAQGKVAGTNAAGGDRAYQPVYVPWGTAAGKWMIGGASFGETTATALGIPFVMGVAEGISRARYYPDAKKIRVKLLAEPDTLRLIGGQMVGGEGIKERADFLGVAIKKGIVIQDLAYMENVYSPAIGALNEPIALAAQKLLSNVAG
jgi:NADH oxidase (H2O2-forming)